MFSRRPSRPRQALGSGSASTGLRCRFPRNPNPSTKVAVQVPRERQRMGVVARPVSAGDSVAELNLRPGQQGRKRRDGHDRHLRDQLVDNRIELGALQSQLDAPSRFGHDPIGGDQARRPHGPRIAPELRPRAAAMRIAASTTSAPAGGFTSSSPFGHEGADGLDRPVDRIDRPERSEGCVVGCDVASSRQRFRPRQHRREAVGIGRFEREPCARPT